MKVIIEAITDWEKDDAEIAGDRDHGGLSESDILLSLAKETKDKKESKWTKGLPFVWEHDVELDIDAVVDIGNEYWQFYCSFPRRGSPDTQIVAKTAKQAKEMLEDLLYNKLEGHDNLKYWQ